MEHAFDNGFVEHGLGRVELEHGGFGVAVLDGGEDLFMEVLQRLFQ